MSSIRKNVKHWWFAQHMLQQLYSHLVNAVSDKEICGSPLISIINRPSVAGLFYKQPHH